MDSQRSFEFDRYPFDEVRQERRADSIGELQAYGALDITHGSETKDGQNALRRNESARERPR
jgi:hypothetical protein